MTALLDLSLSEEQTMLRDSVARLLRAEATPAVIRAAPLGHDPKLWTRLVEMGLPLMRVPPEAGGLGCSLFDLTLVAEEAGRRLAPAPLVETIVAAGLLGQLGGEALALIDEIAAGGIAALALHPLVPGAVQTIPGAAVADFVVGAEGMDIVAYRAMPVETGPAAMGSIPLAECRGGSGDRILLGTGAEALSLWAAAVEEWKIGTAATLAGVGAEALVQAADYACERTQFGRKIGSFQGIAHPLADSVTDVDGARLLVWQAVSAIASGQDDASAMIGMAYWWAGDAVCRATERAVRTFGGYGVSLENDIQLFYRRAKALSLVAGDPERELQRVGDRLWGGEVGALPVAGEVGIQFDWGAQARAFADRLRHFIDDNVDDALRATFHHSTKAHSKPFSRKLAAAGFLYPDLPLEHGGEGRNPIETAAANAVWEEIDWNRTAAGVTGFVLQMEQLWGTEEAKREIAPRMLSGDAVGCLGFSEPQAGSDIFGCQFAAVREGGDWRLNGQKMFTTGGHIADYILLLTRTDNGGAKHEGLTVFIVPMTLPGIEVQPVHTLQDERTNITYFGDVLVADRYRLGEVGQGLKVMQTALELEHGGIIYHYALPTMLRHAVAWASRGEGGSRRIDEPGVRRRLARTAVTVAVSEGLSRRDVWAQANDQGSIAYGPMAKLFSTEGLRAAAADMVALAAPESLLARSDDLGFVETAMRRALAMTIYGGTSEIHRSLIAEQMLKMPKSRT
jgi:alkylation response protein AidB-like acyl-CoA dehydrogenase